MPNSYFVYPREMTPLQMRKLELSLFLLSDMPKTTQVVNVQAWSSPSVSCCPPRWRGAAEAGGESTDFSLYQPGWVTSGLFGPLSLMDHWNGWHSLRDELNSESGEVSFLEEILWISICIGGIRKRRKTRSTSL